MLHWVNIWFDIVRSYQMLRCTISRFLLEITSRNSLIFFFFKITERQLWMVISKDTGEFYLWFIQMWKWMESIKMLSMPKAWMHIFDAFLMVFYLFKNTSIVIMYISCSWTLESSIYGISYYENPNVVLCMMLCLMRFIFSLCPLPTFASLQGSLSLTFIILTKVYPC